MVGHTIEILPFGVLPLLFFALYIFWVKTSEKAEKSILSRTRQGITEFPTVVSLMLYGQGDDSIAFSDDGASVILTIDSPSPDYADLSNAKGVKDYLTQTLQQFRDEVDLGIIDHYVVTDISRDESAKQHRITLTLPTEVVCSPAYIDHEIAGIGRVFKRNNAPGNSIRWLLYSQGERKVVREGQRTLVHIDRAQVVQGFLDEKTITMSERQITRNIQNRLWNRVAVKCISLEENHYIGEIISPAI